VSSEKNTQYIVIKKHRFLKKALFSIYEPCPNFLINDQNGLINFPANFIGNVTDIFHHLFYVHKKEFSIFHDDFSVDND
jgi:hypothetical protein